MVPFNLPCPPSPFVPFLVYAPPAQFILIDKRRSRREAGGEGIGERERIYSYVFLIGAIQ